MTNQSYSEWMAECVDRGMLTAEEARRRVYELPFHLKGVAPPKSREPQGLTIAGLTKTEQVHPKRLLAELAEEFDRGIEHEHILEH